MLLRYFAVGKEDAGNSRWVIVPLLLFWGQGSAGCCIAGLVECLENYQLLTRGVQTEGTVIARGNAETLPGTMYSRGGRFYFVVVSLTNHVVRFSTPDGRTYHSSRIFSVLETENLSPGDKSAVLYLPENPNVAECPGVRMWMSASLYMVLGAACCVPCAVYFLRRTSKKKKKKVKFG